VAGPKIGLAYSVARNCDWWHGHRIRLVCDSYSDVGQPRWLQILENA
jgi:hypothetical protein